MNKLWQLPHLINLEEHDSQDADGWRAYYARICSSFLSLFLLIVSLSSLAVSTDTAIQTYVLIPAFMLIDSDVILPRGGEKLYMFSLRHKSIGAVSLPLCNFLVHIGLHKKEEPLGNQ
ncbi:MAG: hypothetical protein QXX12_05830 [Nanopusillaceae archaeon]